MKSFQMERTTFWFVVSRTSIAIPSFQRMPESSLGLIHPACAGVTNSQLRRKHVLRAVEEGIQSSSGRRPFPLFLDQLQSFPAQFLVAVYLVIDRVVLLNRQILFGERLFQFRVGPVLNLLILLRIGTVFQRRFVLLTDLLIVYVSLNKCSEISIADFSLLVCLRFGAFLGNGDGS